MRRPRVTARPSDSVGWTRVHIRCEVARGRRLRPCSRRSGGTARRFDYADAGADGAVLVGVAAGGGEDAGDDGDVLAEAEADGVAEGVGDVDAEGVGEADGEGGREGLGEAVGDLDECTDGDADALAD